MAEGLKKLFHKEESRPGWDDGSGEDRADPEEAGASFCNKAMGAIGAFEGVIGTMLAKYLHQRFACNAYGIPLTSRKVNWYGIPQVAADSILFFFIYGTMLGLMLVASMGLRETFLKDYEDVRNYWHKSLAMGFAAMVIVSVIFYVVPFNIFLIGVP